MSLANARVLLGSGRWAERETLSRHLGGADFHVDVATSGEETLERLGRRSYALLIADLALPGIGGSELVRRAHRSHEDTAILALVDDATAPGTVGGVPCAGHDYIRRPAHPEEVAQRARRLVAWHALRRENAVLRWTLRRQGSNAGLVARSASMKRVLKRARRAARTRSNVLLVGEPGTHKALIARTIHRLGPRRSAAFLEIDPAGRSEARLEADLFGHGSPRRGSRGVLCDPRAGTILFDDIADLPRRLQRRLVDYLAGREALDVRSLPRVVAATRRDLRQMSASGSFRSDLCQRLEAVRLVLAPLRERPEDIPWLVRQILQRHAASLGVPQPSVTDAAMMLLLRYEWKGNIRELSNVLERALILAGDGRCDVEQLPADLRRSALARMVTQRRSRSPIRGH